MPLDSLIGGQIGAWLIEPVLRRRAKRQRAAGVLECAFRRRTATTSPLMRRWRIGTAELLPGFIVFTPFIQPGIRIKRPFTKPIRIPVVALTSNTRNVSFLERWWVSGTVYEIDTGDGTVEWCASGLADINWALTLLLPADEVS